MKTIFSLIIISLLFTSILTARPHLKLDCGKVYDWGKVSPKDSPLKADIKIYNIGSDTLKIKRVKPMCGCTTAPLHKKIIPPKDSATLKVTLNVKYYEGNVDKRIIISSNNRPNNQTILELKAYVYHPLKFFPNKYFNLGQMFTGDTVIGKIVINNLSENDIVIKDLVKKGKNLTVNLNVGDTIPKDSDFVLEAKIIPKVLGPYTLRLTYTTDSPDVPEIDLSGFGRVEDASKKTPVINHIAPKVKEQTKKGKLITPPPVLNPTNDKMNMPLNPNVNAKIKPKLLKNNKIKFQELPPNQQKLEKAKINKKK